MVQEEKSRSVMKQILLGLVVNLSSLAPSMSLGFSAIALPPLRHPSNPYGLTDDEASWFASVASMATPVGCFLSGPISDRFGRKSALVCVNLVGIAGWIVIAVAYRLTETQYAVLLVGRLLTGLSTGLASMPASVYMAEISSSRWRGIFTTWGAVFFSLGVLVVYALGFIFEDDWGAVAAITACVPAVAVFLVAFFVPESPHWLIAKSRIEEARANLCKIYGTKECTSEVREEVEALVEHREKSKTAVAHDNKTFRSLAADKADRLLRPACRKPFALILTYFFFQQFSGTFVVVFYAIDIVKEAGVTTDPYSAIVAIALTRFLSSILVSFLSKRYGRRPHSIVSGAGMTVCMIALALYLLLINKGVVRDKIGWLPVVLLVAYFFASTLGFLTMPFAMAAEVFPGDIRGTATGLLTCVAYSFSFVTVKLYPAMLDAMRNDGVFCFYGAMALSGTIFIVLFLPETKGKTLREIEEYFGKRNERVKFSSRA